MKLLSFAIIAVAALTSQTQESQSFKLSSKSPCCLPHGGPQIESQKQKELLARCGMGCNKTKSSKLI